MRLCLGNLQVSSCSGTAHGRPNGSTLRQRMQAHSRAHVGRLAICPVTNGVFRSGPRRLHAPRCAARLETRLRIVLAHRHHRYERPSHSYESARGNSGAVITSRLRRSRRHHSPHFESALKAQTLCIDPRSRCRQDAVLNRTAKPPVSARLVPPASTLDRLRPTFPNTLMCWPTGMAAPTLTSVRCRPVAISVGIFTE
jgi:hypothetical protein